MNNSRRRLTKLDPFARKEAVLREMVLARESILAKADKLTPDRIEVKYLGNWSVLELLAHLTGWDVTNLEAIQSLREARLPEFYDHRDPDWRSYNAMLVNRYLIKDLTGMIASVKSSFARLVDLVESIDARNFDRDWGVRYKGYNVTIARLLESEASDEQEHARQLASFFRL